MRLIRQYIIFVLLIAGQYVNAQTDSIYSLTKRIQGDIVDFAVDNLGYIYLVNSDNQVKKLSPNGDSMAVYNDVRHFGKIYFLDVTNPLKILLYQRDFLTIVELDRLLNILNTIDLRNLGIFQAKAIGLAYDNNTWIYDEVDAKLKKVADDGTLVDQTTDIRQFVDRVPDPSSITDQNGLVYLYDSAHGVYIFDHYGAFQKQIQLTGWQDFRVLDKILFGRDRQNFLKYQSGNPDIQKQIIPTTYLPAIKIFITPNSIYVLKQNALEVYSRK
jgi:hypothetical protein